MYKLDNIKKYIPNIVGVSFNFKHLNLLAILFFNVQKLKCNRKVQVTQGIQILRYRVKKKIIEFLVWYLKMYKKYYKYIQVSCRQI